MLRGFSALEEKALGKPEQWSVKNFPCPTTSGRSLENFSKMKTVFSFLFFSGGSFCLLFPAVGKK